MVRTIAFLQSQRWSRQDNFYWIYNGMIKSYFYQFMGPKPPKAKEQKEQ